MGEEKGGMGVLIGLPGGYAKVFEVFAFIWRPLAFLLAFGVIDLLKTMKWN